MQHDMDESAAHEKRKGDAKEDKKELSGPEQRKMLVRRWNALKNERSTWLPHWQELAEQVRPRGSRFFATRPNQGVKVNQKIINGTPGWAARTLAAGMMSGITSPSRPWFRLTTPDPSMAETGAVKEWLRQVEDRIKQAFARCNLYNALHLVYSDLGVHGVAAMYVESDVEDVIRAYTWPVGSYALANSERLAVDTCFREVPMTVGQLVTKFGLEACSANVKNLHAAGNVDAWVSVGHAIMPNAECCDGVIGPKGKQWKSCWWEMAGSDNDGLLRESGYDEFPVMAPRWSTTGEDVYGHSPGMDVLGDCKALQHLERRKGQLVDKVANPPMKGPSSMRNQRTSLLPGDMTYVDGLSPAQTFSPAMEVPPAAIAIVGQEIAIHENRIKTGFYADLWLMLQQADGQMTAREVVERREEKLLQLGTVLERLQDELLDPLIDRVFSILVRAGHIPPPPEELAGMELRVEYVSIMAQAQKLLGTTAIERLVGFASGIAQVKPDVMDKLNTDQIIDEYAAMLGVPPVTVVPDDEVGAARQQRAQQAQQAQQMAQMQQAGQTAKDLGQASTEDGNALGEMLKGMGAR